MTPEEIQQFLPHRYPFLFVDGVTEVEPGEKAIGYKLVSFNEPFFQGHFPNRPVMPGVIMLEALAQLSCILAFKTKGSYTGQDVYLAGFDKVRFRRIVGPGDHLKMTTAIKKQKRNIWVFEVRAEVDGQKAVEAELMAGIGD